MANTPFKPIVNEFEKIGQDVVKNVAKLPTDLLGAALESVGGSSGSGKSQQSQQQKLPPAAQQEGSNWQKISQEHDDKIRKSIARFALEELRTKPKQELSVYDEKQKELEQKKEAQKAQEERDRYASLPQTSSKRPRGDLHGTKVKTGGGLNDKGKNVKAE